MEMRKTEDGHKTYQKVSKPGSCPHAASVVVSEWSQTGSIGIIWDLAKKCQFLGHILDLWNQKLWR